MSKKSISILFGIAGFYEAFLGIAFIAIGPRLFEFYQLTPPNHFAYIHFPAALLITFGIMFFNIARDPVANKNLILYGILLKLSYCLVVFYHWMTGGLQWIWKPMAFCDLIFLILFVIAHSKVKKL